ncbi:MAG: hypothetical protein JNK49_08860 [Planctomycetes bacterium]|nr:hypothetical protein [Planctomycetota bacterium]
METMRSLWLTAALALGAAAATFGFLPGAWPNPLPEGDALDDAARGRLGALVATVDAACAKGDVAAFTAAVTQEHRAALVQQLGAVERSLDGATLRELRAARPQSYEDWLAQPMWACEVRGPRIAIAVQRPRGDGAQLMAFVWDGRALRLDASRHLAGVRTLGEARAKVVEAVGAPTASRSQRGVTER